MSLDQNREQKLDEMFAAYRDASPDFEGGANFMPGMWSRIDARRNYASLWQTWSRRFVAGACCAGLVLLGLNVFSPMRQSAYYDASYVDALEADNDVVVMATLHPASTVEPPAYE